MTMQTAEQFQIEVQGLELAVTSHIINNNEVFRIVFSDNRPPLVVIEATALGRPFWTSIPEGRQREAEFFGRLIGEKLKN
jgi:hypothetical protein